MYRAGEEKDEIPQELALPATELAVTQPPVVAEIDSQRRPGKAVKPNKQAVKDQVQFSKRTGLGFMEEFQFDILLARVNLRIFIFFLLKGVSAGYENSEMVNSR
jgi:hypothetical protein